MLNLSHPFLLPCLLIASLGAAALSLRAGVLIWMALAAPAVPLPLFRVGAARLHYAAAYLAFLLLVWLAGMVRRGRFEAVRSRLSLPLFALALVAVISSVLGNVFYDPDVQPDHWHAAVQVYATALVLLSVGAAFLVAKQAASKEMLHWVYRVVLGAGLVFVVAPYLPVRLYESEPAWWFLVLAHGLALTYARVLCDRTWPLWVKAMGAAIVFVGCVQTVLPQLLNPRGGQWLAGWLAIGVPLAVITVVRMGRRSMIVIVPIGLVLASLFLGEVVERARTEGAGERVGLWLDAFRLASLRPFFGVGPGNYPDYLTAYGMRLDPYAIPQADVTSAHGDYQQVAAEMGFVGLLALLWVLGAAFRLAWRLYRSLEDPFLRAFVLGVFGSLCGVATISIVGDYWIPAYHNGGHTNFCTTVYVWAMIGALMAIESIAPGRRSSVLGPDPDV